MYDNYNYPPGADTPDAPWNEPEVPEQEFNVLCSQTLSKSATVLTNNYIPGASGCDYEPDGEGGYSVIECHDPDDTSDTNWREEWHNNDHYTPIQLIELFKKHLESELLRMESVVDRRRYEHLIEECSNWTEDETEICEE